MIIKPNLNEVEISSNYEEFISFVKTTFSGDRRKRLLELYSDENYALSLSMSPASICSHFHLAIPGGYLIHIMNVVKFSERVQKDFQDSGITLDYTDEERIFAALHHDLGKLGDVGVGDYYVQEDQDWKRRKGEIYRLNPDLQYMDATDRALYTLQKFGITVTQKEFLAIKLSDGMYKEANKGYLNTFNKEMHLKTELPRVIHLADYMSCILERNWANTWDLGGSI